MKKLVVILNSLTLLFFAAFFAYISLGREHLNGLASAYASEKTFEYAEPIIESTYDNFTRSLTEERRNSEEFVQIQEEFDTYHADPKAYIANLIQNRDSLEAPESTNLLADTVLAMKNSNPIGARIASVKASIGSFYEKTLTALVLDLKIVSGSNICATFIALCLAFLGRGRTQWVLPALSFLMFVSVAQCTYLYIDSMNFFRILTGSHMGWFYPVLLAAVILEQIVEVGLEFIAERLFNNETSATSSGATAT